MSERAVLLTAIAEEAQRYPNLHVAFRTDNEGNSGSGAGRAPRVTDAPAGSRVVWTVEGGAALVASEADTVEVLTLLRMHGNVMHQQRHVSGGSDLNTAMWTALINALAAGVKAEGSGSAGTSVALVLHVVVAVYREQLSLGAGAAAQLQAKGFATAKEMREGLGSSSMAGVGKGRRKQTMRALLAQSDSEVAVHQRMARVLTELAAPFCRDVGQQQRQERATGVGKAAKKDSAAASTTVMAVAMAAVATEAAGLLARTPAPLTPAERVAEQPWRQWRDTALQCLVESLDTQDAPLAAAAAADTVVDMLRCLRWTEELEVLLSVSTLGKVSELCQRTLLRTCRVADSTGGAHLFELLCRPVVAVELNHLSADRVTFAQAAADICAVATAYLRDRLDSISSLVDRAEQEHHAAAASLLPPATSLPTRPPLRNPAVQIMYAMLCAGFSAAMLLTSDLCLSLPPRDTLDAVRAAGLFSLHSGTAPLPVRARGVVVDQVLGLLTQCRRDVHRVVNSSVDETGEKAFVLAERLAEGEAAAAAVPTAATRPAAANARPVFPKKQRRGGRRASSALAQHLGSSSSSSNTTVTTSSTSAVLTPAVYRVAVSHAFYVALEAIVESVLRGDVAAVNAISQPLLPLLQQEGREAALTAALEFIWASFKDRLTELGGNDPAHLARLHTAVPTTSNMSARFNDGAAASTLRSGARRRGPPATTTAAMEEALAVLSARFLPAMTESVLKRLTGGAHTASPTILTTTGIHGNSDGAGVGDGVPLRADELIEMALRLSTVAVLCGMPAGTVAHLTTLHNSLLKFHARGVVTPPTTTTTVTAATARDSKDVSAAFAVVERLERFLTDLTRMALPWTRHVQSAHVRQSGVAVQQVLAVYLSSTAALVRDVAQPPATAPAVSASYRHYLLTAVHLLYRLATEFPVEAEPVALRQFRVDVLDPALTAVLLPATMKEGSPPTTAALQLPLTTLTEVVVVMCVPESVQHVSPHLLRGVAASVQRHLQTREASAGSAARSGGAVVVADTVTGVLATQLLCSAATVCFRSDDTLTALLLQMLEGLCPLLTLWQLTTVLTRLHATGAPLAAAPVRGIMARLVEALRAHERVLAAAAAAENGATSAAASASGVAHTSQQKKVEQLRDDQCISTLHTLSAIQRTADRAVAEQRWQPNEDADVAALLRLLRTVPFSPLLHALARPAALQRRRYSIQECGVMVEVVAQLLQSMPVKESQTAEGGTDQPSHSSSASAAHHITGEEAAALRRLPRTLAAYVLQAVQLPVSPHDVPALLRGYAALSSEAGLQQQMLRAFIARTMRAAPAMTPVEVVESVEAYCAAGVFHEQLYGVLLGRAADMGRRLTLELSVRVLRCGTLASHPSVRTVCVTAVQPIFSAQVRGLLQSDPRSAVTVASTALAILHCLRDCFPHDDIAAPVLANVARHHHDAPLSVVKAGLELIERRGSTDYDVAHVLARHCSESVLPTCTAAELVNVTGLLLACGLRTAALLEAVYARLHVVAAAMPGSSLAKLSQSLLRAAVEVDTTVVEVICARVVSLTADKAVETAAVTPSGKGPVKKSAGAAKAKKKATAAEAPPLNTSPTALPMPLTVSQACVFLRLLRSVSRRLVTTAMNTADSVLLYVQTRVVAEAPPLQRGTGASSGDADAAVQAIASAATPPPLPLLTALPPRDVEELLRCCVDLSSRPKVFYPLVHRLADHLGHLLSDVELGEAGHDGLHSTASDAATSQPRRRQPSSPSAPSAAASYYPSGPAAEADWTSDLILLVDLGSLFIRLGEAAHPAVHALYSILYSRRGALLQRALLVKTTRQSLELGGRSVHPELYKLIVDGEIL